MNIFWIPYKCDINLRIESVLKISNNTINSELNAILDTISKSKISADKKSAIKVRINNIKDMVKSELSKLDTINSNTVSNNVQNTPQILNFKTDWT